MSSDVGLHKLWPPLMDFSNVSAVEIKRPSGNINSMIQQLYRYYTPELKQIFLFYLLLTVLRTQILLLSESCLVRNSGCQFCGKHKSVLQKVSYLGKRPQLHRGQFLSITLRTSSSPTPLHWFMQQSDLCDPIADDPCFFFHIVNCRPLDSPFLYLHFA